MDRIERLKAEARETAKMKGHKLGRFKDSVITSGSAPGSAPKTERPAWVAVCEICAAFAVVDPSPAPGEPEILGQAVDGECHPIEGETHESA
jgi:hypothetical protein